MSKTNPGNFFEDFRIGQIIRHATPRTVTSGDVALYTALYGTRFAVQSSDAFAKAIGYPRAPVDDLLVFHIVFGKTVPDVSLNAVANLGYAGCYFRSPVFPGDTLSALSEVIGLKENSSRKTGIVYVRTTRLQAGRHAGARIRALGDGAQSATRRRPRRAITCRACRPSSIRRCWAKPVRRSTLSAYDFALAGSPHRFGDYQVGETHRPRRRRHRRGGRAPDRDAALSEHRAHSLQPVHRSARAASAGG